MLLISVGEQLLRWLKRNGRKANKSIKTLKVKELVTLVSDCPNVGTISYLLGDPLRCTHSWDFPGGPVVKTLSSNAGGAGSIPGRGAKIPHASWPKNQNIKQKQYCNKFNEEFKNGTH